MGSIRNAPSGRWQARYRDRQGRLRSKTFATKGRPRRFLERTGTSMQRGDWVDPRLGRISFSAWATEWERTTVDLRPTTVDLYQYILRSFLLPTFGPVPMGRIAPLEVRAWLAGLAASDVSAASAHRAFRLLRRIMNVAVQSEVIARFPWTAVRPPQVPRNEMRFCTPEEVADLAEVVDPDYRCLVLTAAYTGLRWGELAGLKRKRVDLLQPHPDRQPLTELNGAALRRTQDRRRPAPGEALALSRRAAPGPARRARPSRNGRAGVRHEGGRDAPAQQLPPHLLAPGRPPGRARRAAVPRSERHRGGLAIANGAHTKAIQARMGHSSVSITLDRYGHLLPSLDDQIADGLDRMYRLAEMARAAARPVPVARLQPAP